jgi:predicted nucleic acid-binding protein
MIILDTNVLSELMKAKPSPRVEAWMAAQFETELFTTAITEAEILYGIELLPKGRRRDELMDKINSFLETDMAGRVLPFESDAARVYSQIAARRRSMGKPISHEDAQIAAIVLLQKAQLATRNVMDFRDCGIDLVDPWANP